MARVILAKRHPRSQSVSYTHLIFLYKGHTTVIYKNMSRIGRIGIFAGNPALIKLKQPEDPPFTVRAKAAFSLLV